MPENGGFGRMSKERAELYKMAGLELSICCDNIFLWLINWHNFKS
jgi:hypothetical protein